MSKLITICLTREQQEQLEQIRDTDKRPYMRERTAVVLKIAEGITPRQVALNAVTGQVTYQQASRQIVRQLTKFYDAIAADYPQADTIYMVQDNWPVHYHPDLLIHLHRLSDEWSELKQRVLDFIHSFRRGSNKLLRYVGLLADC